MTNSFNDKEFLDRIRAGDNHALEAVVHAYLPEVVRAARGMGLDAHRAEDVAQATFVTFIERCGDFEGRSQVRTWIFGILYRKIAEERRQLRKDRQMDDIDGVVEQRFRDDGTWLRPPRDVEADAYAAEIRVYLGDCLATLPERQRMAFLLREAEGQTTEEICKILEVTRTNLGVLLFRARNRLRECLEGKGIEAPGATGPAPRTGPAAGG